jgi:AcrR family transcriptional regulator
MGILERREREKEEVRRKILDAARDLFAAEGYERVTMRRIAEAIEYSPTTIYNHFEDKDDLVKALCDEDFAALLGAVRPPAPTDDAVETIRQIGRGYAAFGLAYPNHYRFMFMTTAKFQQPQELSGGGQQAFSLLLSAVTRAVATKRFIDIEPLAAAQVLWSGIHGAVALLITLPAECWPQGPATPDLIERVLDHGLRGYLAAPEH